MGTTFYYTLKAQTAVPLWPFLIFFDGPKSLKVLAQTSRGPARKVQKDRFFRPAEARFSQRSEGDAHSPAQADPEGSIRRPRFRSYCSEAASEVRIRQPFHRVLGFLPARSKALTIGDQTTDSTPGDTDEQPRTEAAARIHLRATALGRFLEALRAAGPDPPPRFVAFLGRAVSCTAPGS